VLEWLGIREILDKHPHLADINLPARILWACAQRVAVDQDDPIYPFLQEPQDEFDQDFDFVAPTAWQRLFLPQNKSKKEYTLCRVQNNRGKRLLYDRRGRMMLASWNGDMPIEVRKLVSASALKRPKSIASTSDTQRIEQAFLVAINCFLRRYVGIGLRNLIKRPGRVAITKTHVDVMFQLNQVDMRIRKAGIDIDPGWVPWLGRVIQFHYLDDEEGDRYEYV
jgi:hypothetical protein